MRRLDIVTSVVLLVVAGYIMGDSGLNMKLWGEFAPGGGFFPFWLGAILAGLALLLLVDTFRRPGEHEGPSPFPSRQAGIAVVTGLLSVGLYAVLLEVVGYVVDTFLVIFILLGVIEKESWWRTLIVAAIITLAFYLLFQVWLGVRLPKNALGF